MPTIETALTRKLGITHPILLAPMGSAAGGKLAAAVTNAGGLGLIGSGYADAATVSRELWPPATPASAWASSPGRSMPSRTLARRARREAGGGHAVVRRSEPYVARIKDAGSKIICQVQTLAEAEQAARLGVDVIIAQGRDAGGHSGTTRGTMGSCRPWSISPAPIPVVAAGGIADGRGLAAVLSPRRLGRVDGHALHRDPRIAVGRRHEVAAWSPRAAIRRRRRACSTSSAARRGRRSIRAGR